MAYRTLTILLAAGTTMLAPACQAQPTPGGAQQTAATSRNEPLAEYWGRFARAALAGDIKGIAATSAPRVTRKGALDDDSSSMLSAAQAAPIVVKLVKANEELDGSGRRLRQALQSATPPARGKDEPLGYRRVGPFIFEQRSGRWMLTTLFDEE